MFEILATPGWQGGTTTVEQWVERLSRPGVAVVLTRDSPEACRLEAPGLRLRGDVVLDGLSVEAINFEIEGPDDLEARNALEAAAADLGWELDDEQGDAD